MNNVQKIILHTDGAAKGNPGPAGAGYIACDQHGEALLEDCVYLGTATNNEAEYQALLHGLQRLFDMGLQTTELLIKSDSELMVRQINGRYKVKAPTLIPLLQQAKKQLAHFSNWKIEHVRRSDNSAADALANKAVALGQLPSGS